MISNEHLPKDIDSYIINGIEKAKKKKRGIRIRRGAGIASILTLVVFFSMIRMSPAFASYISAIPGMDYIVDLIQWNKGLQSAVDNEFIQNINVSDEHQGIVFTVNDIIVDNTSMVVFYSIENKSQYKMPRINSLNITDERNSELKAAFDYGFAPYDGSVYNGRLNISFPGDEDPDFMIPDVIKLTANMEVGDPNLPEGQSHVLDDNWKVSIPIDKSRFENMEKHYVIDQAVEIAGQRIVFENAVIYPTRVSVDISFDKNNTMENFALENLALVDEKGNEWGTIQDGVTMNHISYTKKRVFFQSNFFTVPKELYIRGSGIRALDKDEAEVVIDLDGNGLIKAPDEKLQLKELKLGDKSLFVSFKLGSIPPSGSYTEFLSWNGFDGSNQELRREKEGRFTRENQDYMEYDYEYTFEMPVKSPVRFPVIDYPNRIEKEFQVPILP